MLSPIIGMIHNMKLNRWHPVVFVEKPLPGPPAEDKPVRHKSSMHHTEGLATREEALTNVESDLIPRVRQVAIGEIRTCLEKDFPWDGEGVPTLVVYFAKEDGKIVPALVG